MKSSVVLLSLCLILLLLFGSLLLNPYALKNMDRLLLFAPNCAAGTEMDVYRSWNISDVIVWALMKSIWFYLGVKDHCKSCASYRKFRCHARFDSVQVNGINWWNKARFRDVSIESNGECSMQLSGGTNDAISPWSLIPLFLFQRYPVTVTMMPLADVIDNDTQLTIPAMEILDLDLNWKDISKPVFDINMSNITLNLVIKTGSLPLANMEVTVPSIRLGGWTIKEMLDMIPPPPKEQGLYPRLGVFNIRNVTIKYRERDEDNDTIREEEDGDDGGHRVDVPNEIFVPLYGLTKQAGPDGVDQTKIEALMKEAAFLTIRKYLLGEDAILETLRKSSAFVETFGKAFEAIIHEGGEVIDIQLSRIMNAVKDILEKLDDEWSETVSEQSSALQRFGKELGEGWDVFTHSATLIVGIQDILENWESRAEQTLHGMKKDVENGWKVATRQLHTFESNVENALSKMEQSLEQKWPHVTNDAKKESLQNGKDL